ncbi:transposase [Actinomycetospora aurantiaca]|uniref:transposase n=1 Tax=Actinomycetospora aurantiaca TaxID=3129233 RepID=UPI0035A0905F
MTAAKLIGQTGGVDRFRSRDAFARHNGTVPLPVWSSNRERHRLSRTGNRQLNTAIPSHRAHPSPMASRRSSVHGPPPRTRRQRPRSPGLLLLQLTGSPETVAEKALGGPGPPGTASRSWHPSPAGKRERPPSVGQPLGLLGGVEQATSLLSASPIGMSASPDSLLPTVNSSPMFVRRLRLRSALFSSACNGCLGRAFGVCASRGPGGRGGCLSGARRRAAVEAVARGARRGRVARRRAARAWDPVVGAGHPVTRSVRRR